VELGLYLDSSNTTAVLNRTYAYLHDVVENVTNSDWFKSQTGDVKTAYVSSHNPIGSEKPVKQPEQAQTVPKPKEEVVVVAHVPEEVKEVVAVAKTITPH